MSLDARTLLFSLVLTYTLAVVSMFVAATDSKTPDGTGKWASAMLMETLTWVLIAKRGVIPDFFSVTIANGFMAVAYAMILSAIYEFQQRKAPHWQYWLPIALTLTMAAILVDDIRGRFIWGGLIYGLQMVLIARALLTHGETRAGRAWRLLFGGVIMVMVVLVLRAVDAWFVSDVLAQPQNSATVQPIQLISYIAVVSMALLGSISFVLMVKERTDREVMHLAMTDSLTQIPNRRALMDYAARVLARRNGMPLAMLMIDVDHFKPINDTHGHQIGDEVLCKLTAMLAGRLRGYDLIGRYGGEEFCVVAPETDQKGALALAESLRKIISSKSIPTTDGELTVSVSIGVACCPLNATRKLDEILAEADAALYDAKQTGRNKVVCFGVESA
jgi:diguanylate cyclase (GGDEF)-like protein